MVYNALFDWALMVVNHALYIPPQGDPGITVNVLQVELIRELAACCLVRSSLPPPLSIQLQIRAVFLSCSDIFFIYETRPIHEGMHR